MGNTGIYGIEYCQIFVIITMGVPGRVTIALDQTLGACYENKYFSSKY
jgi:hypothetical protein